MTSIIYCLEFRKPHNVRVIPDAGDVVIVGADIIAKLSAETSRGRPVAASDQRPVIRRNSQRSQLSAEDNIATGEAGSEVF